MAGILKVDQVQSDSNLSFQVAGANVAYMNASGMVYGNTTIGTSIITTAGITFPATQVPSADANVLDDYEEGTWTPTVSLNTSYTSFGTYIKIGRLVYLHGRIVHGASDNTQTNVFQVTGFPFTVDNTNGSHYSPSNTMIENVDYGATGNFGATWAQSYAEFSAVSLVFQPGSASGYIRPNVSSTNNQYFNTNILLSATVIAFTGMYTVS
jgi:hypothetical protein